MTVGQNGIRRGLSVRAVSLRDKCEPDGRFLIAGDQKGDLHILQRQG